MTRATVRRLGVVTAALALVASACGRNDDQAAPEVPRASLLPATTVGATAAPQPGTTVAVHPPTTPLPSSSTTASTTPPPGAAPPAAAPGAPPPRGGPHG
jgi:hypothetical protein